MESADLREVLKRLASKVNLNNPAYWVRAFKEELLMRDDEFDLAGAFREMCGLPPKPQRRIN